MTIRLHSAGRPEQQRDAGWSRLLLRRQQPVQQHREHDDHRFNQSLLIRQAGCWKSRGKDFALLTNLCLITDDVHFCLAIFLTVLYSLQTEYARMEGGKYVYRIHRSPMCEYMINFIHKLKHLPEKYMMNSVLENFTILQVKCIQSCLNGGLKIAFNMILKRLKC